MGNVYAAVQYRNDLVRVAGGKVPGGLGRDIGPGSSHLAADRLAGVAPSPLLGRIEIVVRRRPAIRHIVRLSVQNVRALRELGHQLRSRKAARMDQARAGTADFSIGIGVE